MGRVNYIFVIIARINDDIFNCGIKQPVHISVKDIIFYKMV